MNTNSLLSVLEATNAATGQTRGNTAAFLPQNRPLQAGAATSPAAAVRVPVHPKNRAYLKALREAEVTTWTMTGAVRKPSGIPKLVSVRLPSPKPAVGEGRLYALLTVLCVLTVASEWVSLWRSAPHWSNFIEFVRQLLT